MAATLLLYHIKIKTTTLFPAAVVSNAPTKGIKKPADNYPQVSILSFFCSRKLCLYRVSSYRVSSSYYRVSSQSVNNFYRVNSYRVSSRSLFS
ncbi:hypothetical protein EVA_03920 [gut metagenome]|uniref:Uncharacterized protein n=1 Tax=gut metagenome TaxID=749906 RepID=J9D5I1_9ZZZZ